MSEAWIRMECKDGLVGIETGGELSELVVMAPMAVSAVSKYIYDEMVKDGQELQAEETVHCIQKLLEPTSRVWDFDELGAMMREAENNQ